MSYYRILVWLQLSAFLPAFRGSVAAQSQHRALPLKQLQVCTVRQDQQPVFVLNLQKEHDYILHAEQKGIDVELILRNSGGAILQRQDAPNGRYGPEEIRFHPDSTAAYFLSVAPLTDTANSRQGTFTLLVKEAPGPISTTTLLTPVQMRRDLAVFRAVRTGINSGMYRYHNLAETDSVYRWVDKQISRPLPVTAFYKLLLAPVDFEGSCHNETRLPEEPYRYLPEDRGFFPFVLQWIDGRAVVNTAGAALPVGTAIHRINGDSMRTVLTALFRYFPTDGYNVSQKEMNSVGYGFGWRYPVEFGVADSLEITYSLPGSSGSQTGIFRTVSKAEKQAQFRQRHSLPYEQAFDKAERGKWGMAIVDSATALLSFRTFDMAANAEDPAYAAFCGQLDSFFRLLRQRRVRNLIVDVRHNPGGNDPTYEKVFTYLSDRPFRENTGAYILTDKIPCPQYYQWASSDKDNQRREQQELEEYLSATFSKTAPDRYEQRPVFNPVYYPDSNRFRGRVVLLVDEGVASAASHFASLVKGYTGATVVGRETGGGYYGHNGHTPVEYRLPESGIVTRFSIVYVTQDAPWKASQPRGRGIIPDLEVGQSFDDFLRNEDTQMKAALRLLRQ